MPEIAMHILDLVQNSISAGARLITVKISLHGDRLVIEIIDDGRGMSEEFVARVTSPFTTSRTTRKVGLGIPLFKQLAEATGGGLKISSVPGSGTTLRAEFGARHVDLPPMGDLTGTFVTLLNSNPESPEFRLEYANDLKSFALDTREVRAAMGGLPLNLPDVLDWVREYLDENILEVGNI